MPGAFGFCRAREPRMLADAGWPAGGREQLP